MTTTPSSASPGYDPFAVKKLEIRTRRLFAPSGGSISFKSACFLVAFVSSCFYLLVPLEYIRPDIIGWNRTARARAILSDQQKQKQQQQQQ